MNRIDAARNDITRNSRPLRLAAAAAIVAFIGVNMSVAAVTGHFSKPQGAAPVAAASQNCRQQTVETDEGYGVRGTVIRTVCGAA